MVEEIEDVLGKGILEKILNLLFEENPLSYNQISEKISIDYGTLKKTMIRNKDYFQESSKDGKTKFFKLSILGEKFVREKLEDYKKKQDYFKELDEALKRKQVLVEELSEEVKNIIQNKEINLNREGKSIYIDVGELAVENPALSEMLLEKPDEVIGVFKNSLEKDYDIRFKNLPKTAIINIEELRQEHLNKLIMVECRSVSLSNVRPIIKNIKFECPSCGTVHSVLQNDSFIRRPSRCSCGRKGGFREISKEMVNAANVMLEDLTCKG